MPLDTTPDPLQDAPARRPLAHLAARDWRAKLYAPDTPHPDELAAAKRAFRAAIAVPGAPVAGFALLRPPMLSVFWWEGAILHRIVLAIAGNGTPPRRAPVARIGSVADIALIAREAAAWRRHVLLAAAPSPEAYLAECCA